MNRHVRHAVLAGICLALLAGCARTPQIGGDKECFSAADALWTAVSAKRPDLLDRSAAEVERLHAGAKLPDEAFESLSSVVSKARAGQWSDARAALKTFIRAQRPATG